VNIGVVATRLSGTDGVSLEAAKLGEILRAMGHESRACAGEIDGWGESAVCRLPEMHFMDPQARAINAEAFSDGDPTALRARITERAALLRRGIGEFIAEYEIDALLVENALAIPMHLPLGVALTELIEASGIPTIAHHHDFHWERERFSQCVVPDLLERCFPPNLPSIRHIVINSLAQAALKARRGLPSTVLPNLLDFESGPPQREDRSNGLRRDLRIDLDERIILQPTRVVARKGIEHAVELVRRLQQADSRHGYRLLMTHGATDEGTATLARLRGLAHDLGVRLLFAPERFAATKDDETGEPGRFDLQDAYTAADFVTYPSLLEGFGNAFLEAVFFRRPILVNRYPVYVADIEPLGFRVVAMEGTITTEAVDAVRSLLDAPAAVQEMADYNYGLAAAHFSYAIGRRTIAAVLESLP